MEPEHWAWDVVARLRGNLLAAQKRHAEALPQLQRAASNYERDLGADSPAVLWIKLELAETLLALDRKDEARTLVAAVEPLAGQRLAKTHPAQALLRRLRRELG